ncbi:hypothetical protein [uncultured Roseobacter sp.]|uniref:hypothetical protein n=1 Tax=uncultured Roseobacter sp. TaxID=114847 RepID=UPI002603D693|nr:hypothetical protein [uncultured Roseobacter sp.]
MLNQQADRLRLSHLHICGAPRAALRKGVLCPNAPECMRHLVGVFAADEHWFFGSAQAGNVSASSIRQITARPALTEFRLRRVMVALPEKLACAAIVVEVAQMPGRNADLIADMTAA